MAAGDLSKRLPEAVRLRGIFERQVYVVGHQLVAPKNPGRAEFGVDRDFGFPSGNTLGGADDFSRDGAQFARAQRSPRATGKRDKNEGD